MRQLQLTCAAFASLMLVSGTAMRAQTAQRDDVSQVPVRFTVRVENVSTSSTLRRSSGGPVAIALSPGVWAVHTATNPILAPGQLESGLGLKGLAEAGMARAFAPNLGGVAGVKKHGVFNEPVAATADPVGVGTSAGGPGAPRSRLLQPGFRFEFTIEARPGDRLSLAVMIGESNDGLLATGAEGMALFDANGRPISGNMTAQVFMWDAGTEVNEEPGLGRNQGARQAAPHAGDPERRPVRLMSEAEFGGLWPTVSKMVRVTLQADTK